MPSKLLSARSVLESRSSKICAKDPIHTTEQFLKYDQSWPINEEKDEKDKPETSKKQKMSEEDGWKDALKKVSQDKRTYSQDKYISVSMLERKEISEDTRIYSFKHQLDSISSFKLGIGQHVLCGFMMQDGIVERPYAIVRPTGNDKDDGTIDILVKTAFPSEKDPGGTVSNVLDMLSAERGDEMLIRGPEGPISYCGDGKFVVNGKERGQVKKINFISGGTGMTPIYATIRAILETDKESSIKVHFLDANQNQKDILLHKELNELAEKHERFTITHVLEKPEDGWDGEKGLVDEKIMKKYLYAAADDTVTLVCGPPPMVDAMKKGLKANGFEEDKTFFHY